MRLWRLSSQLMGFTAFDQEKRKEGLVKIRTGEWKWRIGLLLLYAGDCCKMALGHEPCISPTSRTSKRWIVPDIDCSTGMSLEEWPAKDSRTVFKFCCRGFRPLSDCLEDEPMLNVQSIEDIRSSFNPVPCLNHQCMLSDTGQPIRTGCCPPSRHHEMFLTIILFGPYHHHPTGQILLLAQCSGRGHQPTIPEIPDPALSPVPISGN